MTIRTYDKNGEPNNVCWRNVQKIKLMVIPGTAYRDTLLNLHMTFDKGQEVDYYLSEHERFAVIEQGEYLNGIQEGKTRICGG